METQDWVEVSGLGRLLGSDGKIVVPDWANNVRLDVGLSFNAPNSQVWLQSTTDRVVFGFEPNPESVGHIKRGIKVDGYIHLNPDYIGVRFFMIPCALSSSSEMKKFYMIEDDPGCSSVHVPTKILGMPVKRMIEVPCIPLSMFLERFPWDRIPYIEHLKIDAQGHDLEILKGAGEYLDKVVFLTVEITTHGQYLGTPKPSDIKDYMESRGFYLDKWDWSANAMFHNPRFLKEIEEKNLSGFSLDQ